MKRPSKFWVFWEMLQIFFYRHFGRHYQCGCGHTAKWKTHVVLEGHRGVYKLSGNTPDYCPECWRKAVIKCAWCGELILPGDPITLYELKEGSKMPQHAVVYKSKPCLLVGCLYPECTSGAGFCGHWVMPGKVRLLYPS